MKTFRLSLIALSLFPLPSIGDDLGAEVQTSAAPKTPAIKTITNFTQSYAALLIVTNAIVDVAYQILDPRMKVEG